MNNSQILNKLSSQSNGTLEYSPKLAEVSLKYKTEIPTEQMPKVTNPREAVEVLRTIWDQDTLQLKEEFVVLLLNHAKYCLGWCKISSGGGAATVVDPAAIFQIALLVNADAIVLAHNHPSGNIEPSSADKTLTRRIKKSGELLGVTVEDHIILTKDRFISFRMKEIL